MVWINHRDVEQILVPLTLNWFGMAVHDFPAAFPFYGERLQFSVVDNEAKGFWKLIWFPPFEQP